MPVQPSFPELDSPVRLAVVSTQEGAPWGGSEALWAAAAGAALEQGWEVLLSLKRWPQTPEPVTHLTDAGAALHLRDPRGYAGRALPRVARRLQPVLGSVIRWRPDVVFVSHGGTYDLTYDIDVLRDLRRLEAKGVPVLAFCNGGDDFAIPEGGQRDAAVGALQALSQVFFTCVSHLAQTERHLATRLSGAGILINPLELEDAVAWPEGDTLNLACVGALNVRTKGQDLLLAALSGAPWRDRDWQLHLYGRGPDEAYLRQLTAMYALSHKVEFHGHVDPTTIWEHCHVLVMASRREGLPLVIQEAALAGRPTLATDVGGTAELVRHGQTGFLAACPTERALGAALEDLWRQRADLQEMGARAASDCRAYRKGDPVSELLQRLRSASAVRGPSA